MVLVVGNVEIFPVAQIIHSTYCTYC